MVLPLLLLLATADGSITADGAGNRMVPFPVVGAVSAEAAVLAPHCAAGAPVCARLVHDGHWGLALTPRAESGAPVANRPALTLPDPNHDAEFALRPELVEVAGGSLLVMVERTTRTAYAGGGGGRTDLLFVFVGPGAGARVVMELPLSAAREIRACFTPRDRQRRRGACEDRYELSGTVVLDPATRSGVPRFLLNVGARTFPGRQRADHDSTRAPALGPHDLVWAGDARCTYRREIVADDDFEYRPDRPLPDCSDYLDL